MSSKRGDAVCAITLTPLSQLSDDEKMFLPCSHGFEKKAIQKHLARIEQCPVCRTSIHASVTELGVMDDVVEEHDKKMQVEESDDEDDESSATLNSEEPRSEETGSMGSLRDFIEDDIEDDVEDDEDSFEADEDSDDTITSEVDSNEVSDDDSD